MRPSIPQMFFLLVALGLNGGCGSDPAGPLDESLGGKADYFSEYNITFEMAQQVVVLDQENPRFFLEDQPLQATIGAAQGDEKSSEKRALTIEGTEYIVRPGAAPFHAYIKTEKWDGTNQADLAVLTFYRREGTQDSWEPLTLCDKPSCQYFIGMRVDPAYHRWFVNFQWHPIPTTDEPLEFLITPAIYSDWWDIEGEYRYQIDIHIED